eukprot:g63902.t1
MAIVAAMTEEEREHWEMLKRQMEEADRKKAIERDWVKKCNYKALRAGTLGMIATLLIMAVQAIPTPRWWVEPETEEG